MRYLLMTRRHRLLQTSYLLGFQSPDLVVHQSQAGLFPTDLSLQVRRERGSVPEPGGCQALQEVVARLQADPLRYSQRLEAVTVPRALLLESLSCPVQPSRLFFLDTGNVHHTPDPLFPVMVADQQA